MNKEQLIELIGKEQADEWYDAMAVVLPKYEINTPKRIAGFVAQCYVESGGFKVLEENLNYSVSALNRVFKRYFKSRKPENYANNPEKLANYVYMDKYRTKRGALGNVEDGDGWLFRGRGLKQITGRSNYQAFADHFDLGTAENAIEFIETKEGALTSAVWFWQKANCNRYADSGDIEGLSKAINGGTNGLNKRIEKWEHALSVLESVTPVLVDEPISYDMILRIGSKSQAVYDMQLALGMSPSERGKGVFGPQTHRAVKAFQRANGLVVDGIAGPNTLKALYSK